MIFIFSLKYDIFDLQYGLFHIQYGFLSKISKHIIFLRKLNPNKIKYFNRKI